MSTLSGVKVHVVLLHVLHEGGEGADLPAQDEAVEVVEELELRVEVHGSPATAGSPGRRQPWLRLSWPPCLARGLGARSGLRLARWLLAARRRLRLFASRLATRLELVTRVSRYAITRSVSSMTSLYSSRALAGLALVSSWML